MGRGMGRFVVMVALLLGAGGTFCRAYAAQDGSDPQLAARIVMLEKKFMAPCCWSQTAHDHKSGAGGKMRDQIRVWVDEGLSDEEITARFVAEYGERILAMPRASGLNLAAYVMPAFFPLAGAALLLIYLRSRSSGKTAVSETPVQLSDADRSALDRALAERDG